MSDQGFFRGMTNLLFEKIIRFVVQFPAATANGTGGLYGLANASGVCTFTDAAALFTPAMVGQSITISGVSSYGNTNNGTYRIVGYTSTTVITIYNPAGVIDTDVDHWIVYPDPTIIAGDKAGNNVSVLRIGVGQYCVTTASQGNNAGSFAAGSYTGLHGKIQGILPGVWDIVGGPGGAVQNINGQHPFYQGITVDTNSISSQFSVVSTVTLTDPIPATAVTGTNGVPAAPAAGSQVCTFIDATAGTFIPSMVGQNLVCTGGTYGASDGTFLIVGYINAQEIIINNPAAVVDSSVHWSVTVKPTAALELTLNDGTAQ